jgi:hypothetical protein
MIAYSVKWFSANPQSSSLCTNGSFFVGELDLYINTLYCYN